MNAIRALIVDDHTHIADTLARTLRLSFGEQLEVESCRTAEMALECLDQKPFDLLITDWHLPGISGLALILRARKKFPNLKIVFMTALPVAKIEQKVRLIADMSIKKPFHAHILATQLQGLLVREGMAE